MDSKVFEFYRNRIDAIIMEEYQDVTNPRKPADDEWIHTLDHNSWRAWARSSRLPGDVEGVQREAVQKRQKETKAK